MLLGGLFAGEREAWLKGRKTGLQRLPGVVEWQQQNAVAKVLDGHFSAREAVGLGQPDGLTAAGLKDTGGVHGSDLAGGGYR